MKLWTCYNCADDKGTPGKHFTAEQPVCPSCGLSGGDPQYGGYIVGRRVIHFEMPHHVVKDRGCGTTACGKKRGPDVRASGEFTAANCPMCIASNAYQAAKAARDGVEEVELPPTSNPRIAITPDGLVALEN